MKDKANEYTMLPLEDADVEVGPQGEGSQQDDGHSTSADAPLLDAGTKKEADKSSQTQGHRTDTPTQAEPELPNFVVGLMRFGALIILMVLIGSFMYTMSVSDKEFEVRKMMAKQKVEQRIDIYIHLDGEGFKGGGGNINLTQLVTHIALSKLADNVTTS